MDGISTRVTHEIEPPRVSEIAQFSKTLECIYDCVWEPDNWTEALHQINALVGADSSAFHWGDLNTRTILDVYHVGMTPEFLEALRHNSIYWAMQIDAASWTPGDVHYLADLLPRQELEQGRFYRDVLKPHEQFDHIAMNVVQDGPRLSNLSVNTTTQTGFFKPRAVELMRLVAPHLCRAARISSAFDLKSFHASMLEKTFDTLASGVVLLSGSGQAIYTNESAQRLLKNHGGIRLADQKLAIKDPATHDLFATSLADLRNPAVAKKNSPVTIAISDAKSPLILTLMPIESGRRKGLIGAFEATMALFIQNMGLAPPIPGETFTQLYGFTAKERKVSMALLQGLSVSDTADTLGIEESTVRTHLKSIFLKTCTNRQPELIQLLMRAMSPVAGSV